MIPTSHALVSLKPARQAAIPAISHVESARERGAQLSGALGTSWHSGGNIIPMPYM